MKTASEDLELVVEEWQIIANRRNRLIGSGGLKDLKCDLMMWRGRLVGAHGLNVSLFWSDSMSASLNCWVLCFATGRRIWDCACYAELMMTGVFALFVPCFISFVFSLCLSLSLSLLNVYIIYIYIYILWIINIYIYIHIYELSLCIYIYDYNLLYMHM